MKTLIASFALVLSTSVFADGFKCEQREHGVNIKVFNHTNVNVGTRNAAVMVFSDAYVAHGNKTIASFTSQKRRLGQNGTNYFAVVDLRVSESNRAGENVLGTKLGQLKEIYVDINHSYATSSVDGEYTDGTVTLVKRNGQTASFDLDCVRYKKN